VNLAEMGGEAALPLGFLAGCAPIIVSARHLSQRKSPNRRAIYKDAPVDAVVNH